MLLYHFGFFTPFFDHMPFQKSNYPFVPFFGGEFFLYRFHAVGWLMSKYTLTGKQISRPVRFRTRAAVGFIAGFLPAQIQIPL